MKIHQPFRTALIATLGVGLGIMLIGSFSALSSVLLYIGTALFLSLGIDPFVRWLESRKLPRWAALLTAILALLAVFAGIVAIVMPVIIAQVVQLVERVTQFVNRPNFLVEIRELLSDLFPALDVAVVINEVQAWLISNVGSITGSVIQISVSFFTAMFGAFIVLILTIYFTASMPSLKRAFYALVPASKRERVNDIGEQITDSVGFFVMGQLTLGAINGGLSLIYLSIIQAPFPAVLAVIAFFFSLIPMVGTLTGSAIIVLLSLIPGLGSPATAIAAGVYYLIYMQVEAYVISPRIMSRAVAVPGAIVVVAALSGGVLLGLLGALIAIPVAASLLIIYRQVVIPRMEKL
jgi:predicted PurR-regulated permease PerM